MNERIVNRKITSYNEIVAGILSNLYVDCCSCNKTLLQYKISNDKLYCNTLSDIKFWCH